MTEASGQAVQGAVSMTFRLYDAATSGTQLWTEDHALTLAEIDDGIFNVILGSTTSLTAVNFNAPLWLSVQVAGDAEMSPRQRLTSTGYAINADKLDALDSGSFMRTDVDTSTSGKLTITRSGTAVLVKPTTAPAANTKMMDVQDAAGTTKFSVDYEGDTTVAGNLAVTGTISGSTDVTGTANTTWTVDMDLDSASTEPAGGAGLVLEGGSGDASILWDATNDELDINKNVNISGTLTATSMTSGGAAVGDITSVTAGSGLTGGATVGDVTLNIGASTGITVNADDIAIDTTVVPRLAADNTFSGINNFTGTFQLASTTVSATAAELNKLSGASSNVTATNLNTLTGGGSTTLHIHSGSTVTGTVDASGTNNLTWTIDADNSGAVANGAGLVLEGTTDKSILWDATNTEFDINDDVNLTGDMLIDTTGLADLATAGSGGNLSLSNTTQSEALAVATVPTATDSDGVLKLGRDAGAYEYIWYDNDARSGAGEFVFSASQRTLGSSPAYISFSEPNSSNLYALKFDGGIANNAADDVLQFVKLNRATTPETETALFEFTADGSYSVFDTTGNKNTVISAGRQWQQEFHNLAFNGSFEAFSGGASEAGGGVAANTFAASVMDGWSNFAGAAISRLYAPAFGYADSSNVEFGYASVKVEDNSVTAIQGIQQELPSSELRNLRGQKVTLSVFAKKGTPGTTTTSIGFEAQDSTGALIAGTNRKDGLSVNGAGFTLLDYTFTVPSNAGRLVIRLYGADASVASSVCTTGIDGCGGIIYDGVTLVEGALVSPFRPSPIVDTGFQTLYGDLEIAKSGLDTDKTTYGVSSGGNLGIWGRLFVGGGAEIKGGSLTLGRGGGQGGIWAYPVGMKGTTPYKYVVTSVTSTGIESLPIETYLPDGPTTLTAADAIKIEWDSDPNATSYKVYGRNQANLDSGTALLATPTGSPPPTWYVDVGTALSSGAPPAFAASAFTPEGSITMEGGLRVGTGGTPRPEVGSPVTPGNAFIQGTTQMNGDLFLGGGAASGNLTAAPDIQVGGNVIAAKFFGDGSNLTGVGSAGGVLNTGSTTIGADTDSDGSGEIVLQTKTLTRMTVANNGDIGVGVVVPAGKLHVVGKDDVADVAVFMPGADTATAGVPDLRVGIGTTVPGQALDVVGDVTVRSAVSNQNTLEFNTVPGGPQQIYTSFAGTAIEQPLQLGTNSNKGAVHIATSGNVGIGTTSPGNKLHVAGGVNLNTTNVQSSVNLGGGNIFIDGGILQWGATGSGADVGLKRQSAGVLKVTNAGDTGNADLLVTGNVGIGTTGPNYKLHVVGSADGNIKVQSTGDNYPYMVWNVNGANKWEVAVTPPRDPLGADHFYISNAPETASTGSKFIIRSTGNVGIGTTAPVARLHTQGAAAVAGVGTLSSSGTTVTGASTTFTSQLKVGDLLTAGTQTRVVTAISTDLALTVDSAFSPVLAAGTAYTFQQPIMRLADSAGATHVLVTAQGDTIMGNMAADSALVHDLTANQDLIVKGNLVVDGTLMQHGGSTGSTFETLTVTGATYLATTSGNVGIGTTGPKGKLHVSGGSIVFDNNQGIASRNVGDTSNVDLFRYLGAQLYIGQSSVITDIQFQPGAATTLTLLSNGNVGIGTTSPDKVLTVDGGDGAAITVKRSGVAKVLLGDSGSADTGDVLLYDSTGSLRTVIRGGADSYITNGKLVVGTSSIGGSGLNTSTNLSVGGTYFATAAPANGAIIEGNVGIGTTAPNGRLHVVYGAANYAGRIDQTDVSGYGLAIYAPNANNNNGLFAIDSAAGALMRVLNNGNVGIGTTGPAEKLDVAGNVRIRNADRIYLDAGDAEGVNTYVAFDATNNYASFIVDGVEVAQMVKK